LFQLSGKTVCTVREIQPARAVSEIFAGLRADPYPWLLESALPSKVGRYSFAGADPYLVIRGQGLKTEIECTRAVRPGLSRGRWVTTGDSLEVARNLMPEPPSRRGSVDLPFQGGAVGYLGYELAEQYDVHHFNGIDDLRLPDLYLLFVDRFIAHDAKNGKLYACGLGFSQDLEEAADRARDAIECLHKRIAQTPPPLQTPPTAALQPETARPACFDASSYAKAVDSIKDDIRAGEVYQACLTRRAERACSAEPWTLYQVLRDLNPAPFASYFELPEVAIIGSSPERFLRLDGDRRVESRPIKGTRPRGCDEAEDRANFSELAASAKDRAENLMIVDLVRNDLGRVCELGSVKVPELMAIESYASVFQMVSTIEGRLRADRDVFDLVRAAFPPGSMTGAPKVAAMRILDKLEPVRRGIYSGAIGYFDLRGGADLSVVIRTLLLHQGRAYLHTGGGIVADSRPQSEWQESVDKARLLEAALEKVERDR
jgi:para-aminobenzoate synthetase component 1